MQSNRTCLEQYRNTHHASMGSVLTQKVQTHKVQWWRNIHALNAMHSWAGFLTKFCNRKIVQRSKIARQPNRFSSHNNYVDTGWARMRTQESTASNNAQHSGFEGNCASLHVALASFLHDLVLQARSFVKTWQEIMKCGTKTTERAEHSKTSGNVWFSWGFLESQRKYKMRMQKHARTNTNVIKLHAVLVQCEQCETDTAAKREAQQSNWYQIEIRKHSLLCR